MNNQQLTPEQNYQVLLDALKYTSDIVVTLTEKNTINESKIATLEKLVQEQKNLINKNNKLVEELEKKLSHVEKNIITSINKDLLLIKNNQKSNIELLSKTATTKSNSKIELENDYNFDSNNNDNNTNEDFDTETINNTICNTTLLSDVTSFNLEEIEKIKKQKAATSLVETLIRKKKELENQINDLTTNTDTPPLLNTKSSKSVNKEKETIVVEEEKVIEPETKTVDLNAIRRKKNFARKF